MGDNTNDTAERSSGNAMNGETGKARAGWWLLGAAAVLAAGSIGYNIYDGQAEAGDVATDAAPSIDDLRREAENSESDAEAWSELAFALYNNGEFDEASSAYERAVEIDPDSAALWSALGESRAYASERDPLPPGALEAFERALSLDSQDPRARYFLAVQQDIDGEHEAAISAWLSLLSDTPPGAPWESDLVRTIEQVGAINEIDVEDRLATVMEARAPEVVIPGSGEAAGALGQGAASPNVRGPNAAQVAEASRMTPGEQQDMVAGMVASLEQRLESEPNNLDGWVMLMRSRMTLGETGRAREALQNAIAANPANAEELRRQAEQLGID